MYLSNPCGDGTGPGLGSWWEDALAQVAQAGADYVTQEATGVPTYGGSPAYPTTGYPYSPTPAPTVLELEEPSRFGWLMPVALGGAVLIGLRYAGVL